MRVLHITTWYPNKENMKEALWIKRHIDSLKPYCDNEVWHIRTIENAKLNFSSYADKDCKHRLISFPSSRWFVIELLTFFQLLSFIVFHNKSIQQADVVNFHIAYPSLTYWKYLRVFIKKPVVITEHWSAYHFNFGVKGSLPKIQNIFKFKLPVMTVSKALLNDIEVFSGGRFPSKVIPNVVDTSIFKLDSTIVRGDSLRFFMVSQWNFPKDPFTVINAFSQLVLSDSDAKLIIGGYGNQEIEILNLIESLDLKSSISFLGHLSSDEIANEMNKATAFIHLSTYETFSVVCAEAICCGCPVIASDVGGIKEFINTDNGVLIDKENDLHQILVKIKTQKFVREKNAEKASDCFSVKTIGMSYIEFLNNQQEDKGNDIK
jgi:glycosyltransferase involved in cell wall biosynthesis